MPSKDSKCYEVIYNPRSQFEGKIDLAHTCMRGPQWKKYHYLNSDLSGNELFGTIGELLPLRQSREPSQLINTPVLIYTSQYLWKFHSLLFASSPLLYLASLLLPPPPPPPLSNTPLEEACSATQNTLINMKEATN